MPLVGALDALSWFFISNSSNQTLIWSGEYWLDETGDCGSVACFLNQFPSLLKVFQVRHKSGYEAAEEVEIYIIHLLVM